MDLIIFFINFLFAVYYLLILARVLLTFIPHNRYNLLLKPIYGLTDPVLIPIRQGLPPIWMGYDVAPFIVILVMAIFQRLLLYILGG